MASGSRPGHRLDSPANQFDGPTQLISHPIQPLDIDRATITLQIRVDHMRRVIEKLVRTNGFEFISIRIWPVLFSGDELDDFLLE